MDLSFYQLGEVYKNRILLENQSIEMNNSMQSFTQPSGSMPIAGTAGNVGVNDTPVNFPSLDELTVPQKRRLLIKFLKDEIDEHEQENDTEDENHWDSKTMHLFSLLYGHFLDSSDDGDEEYEDLVASQDKESKKK